MAQSKELEIIITVGKLSNTLIDVEVPYESILLQESLVK
jgi:hypothetical protein